MEKKKIAAAGGKIFQDFHENRRKNQDFSWKVENNVHGKYISKIFIENIKIPVQTWNFQVCYIKC